MREPDLYIGGKDDPYLLRWYLIPRNRFFNVYLHKIVRSDDDRALHDHPWWWLSVMLKGRYAEVTRVQESKGRIVSVVIVKGLTLITSDTFVAVTTKNYSGVRFTAHHPFGFAEPHTHIDLSL
jgi:hypothetical protein